MVFNHSLRTMVCVSWSFIKCSLCDSAVNSTESHKPYHCNTSTSSSNQETRRTEKKWLDYSNWHGCQHCCEGLSGEAIKIIYCGSKMTKTTGVRRDWTGVCQPQFYKWKHMQSRSSIFAFRCGTFLRRAAMESKIYCMRNSPDKVLNFNQGLYANWGKGITTHLFFNKSLVTGNKVAKSCPQKRKQKNKWLMRWTWRHTWILLVVMPSCHSQQTWGCTEEPIGW